MVEIAMAESTANVKSVLDAAVGTCVVLMY